MFEVWRSAGMACLAMPIHFGPCPWALHQFLSSTMHMVSLGPSVLLCSTEAINQLKATLGDNISWFEVFKRPGQINTHQDSNRELGYLTQFFPAWRATLHLLFISGHQEMPMSWYAISQSLILLTRSFATRQAVKWRTPRIFYQPINRLSPILSIGHSSLFKMWGHVEAGVCSWSLRRGLTVSSRRTKLRWQSCHWPQRGRINPPVISVL